MDALALLRAASELGVKVVQFCDNLPLAHLSPEELDRLEAQARDTGLTLELGTRGLDADNLRAHLALASRFRATFVRVVIDKANDEPTPAEVVQRLQPLRKDFERAGVRLAIENHDRFSSRTLATLIDQLGPAWTGICLDTVNSFGALEGPEVVLDALWPLTLCLHVKDFTIRRVSHQMGFVVEGCAAGSGRLNVPWLLQQLRGCPHPFNAILETWVSPGNSLEETMARERSWTEQGVRYLRGLIPA